jgi:two-component system chemotaxis response regulator CheY
MPIRVLVVDDSRATRRFICRVVELSGIEVEEFLQAGDGEEALALLRGDPVDLVLTDINMPKMNGEQFLRAMKSEPGMSRIPVVVVSTDATDNRRARVFALGACGYVFKPVTPEALQRELDRVLQDRSSVPSVSPVCPIRPSSTGSEPLLNSVTAHALETMCFTAMDGVVTPPEQPDFSHAVSVKLRFGGDAVGWLGLAITSEAAVTMTSNFFGCEEGEVQADQVESFAGELANVICGSVLGWCKTDGHFELCTPEPASVPLEGGAENQCTMTYLVEDGAIRVSLEIGLVDSVNLVHA